MQRWNVSTPTFLPELSGMIVYGDPSSQESFAALFARLESLSALPDPSPDDLRRLLVAAGILEQGVEDSRPEYGAVCRAFTDRVAERFLLSGEDSLWGEEVLDAFETLGETIRKEGPPLAFKIPEGYAFYALYPETYAASAQRWAEAHPEGRVTVVGIRSIGTSLSAVLGAALRERGRDVDRLTVRPGGHPFARETELPPLDTEWVLVVDEGPGLSGSSMASVADAAVRRGIPRERIVFLPGHGGEPGGQASESVRNWWRDAPRFVAPTESLRWQGRTLVETLAHHTEAILGASVVRVEDHGGGLWRKAVWNDPAQWPAVALPFERPKVRLVVGDGRALLWKFVGLTVPDTVLGYAPTLWIEGVPLTARDAGPGVVAALRAHLVAGAQPPLSSEAARAACARLEEMLRVNVREGLGRRVTLVGPDEPGAASTDDDRLAPHEWRRLRDGSLVKVGRRAPTGDHTIVGRQPLAWAVAAAMVEWNLDDPTEFSFVAPEILRFYRAAYAAFRLGQCAMFAGTDEEGRRLAQAADVYRERLSRLL